MPMEHEKHEELLNELLTPDIEHSRKTEILQELRADYGGVHSDFESLTKSHDKLKSEHADMVVTNSTLFRKLGHTEKDNNEEEEKRSFSESVKLEDLEKEA